MTARDPIGFGAPPFCDEPDRPLADEPCSWSESWWFIAPVGVIAFGALLASAWGALP